VLRGAEHAIEVGAPGEAQRIVEAFVTVDTASASGDQVRLLLARAYLSQSKAHSALPVIERLSESTTLTSADAAHVARLAASAEYLLGRDGGTRYEGATDRALELARAAQDPDLIARALFESARAGVENGNEPRITQALAAIEDLISQGPFATRLPVAHYARAYCQYYRREPRAAAQSLSEAVRLLADSKDIGELSKVLTGLGSCNVDLCEHTAAADALQRALDLAGRISDDSRVSIICGNLCTQSLVQGQFAQAVEYGLKSAWHGRIAMVQPSLGATLLSLCEAYLMVGEPARADDILQQAHAWLIKTHHWKARVEFLCQSAFVALIRGNQGEALELISSAEQLADGREYALAPVLAFDLLKLFRVANIYGAEAVLSAGIEMRNRFENRHPLLFLDAVAANAWIENRLYGRVGDRTRKDLLMFDQLGASGRKMQLVQEGFIPTT
jgi:tetratricopeptide (TPR) repeat protein